MRRNASDESPSPAIERGNKKFLRPFFAFCDKKNLERFFSSPSFRLPFPRFLLKTIL